MVNFWRNRPTLVTGCTGVLGSWLTAELCARGAAVVGVVRDQVPQSNLYRSETAPKMTIVRGEIEDYCFLERVLNEYEIDTVFHLAAQTIVSIANRSPLSTFESNIKGTWNLLEASRRTPTLTRFILASSDKAYGSCDKLTYTEQTPLRGLHPYDVSKSCADLIAQTYYHTYKLPLGITRCGNLFGGGDLNFNRIVPGTYRFLYYGEPPVIRSDGTPLRDYVFVKNIVDAYLLLAENLERDEVVGQAFNFGPSKPLSVLEMVQAIIRASGKDIKPDVQGKGQIIGEIQDQYLCSEKAKRLLNWAPRYSLEEGLRETWKWYQDFFAQS